MEVVEMELVKQAERERTLIKFGMELAKIKQEYWFKDLMKFLKGEDEEHHGDMYFCNLKPLYDRYGYDRVNNILMNWEERK